MDFHLFLVDIDYKIFHFLNGLAGQSKLLDSTFVVLAEYVIFLMVASLAIFILLKESEIKNRSMAIFQALAAALIGRGVIASVIRVFFFRPRPFVAGVVTQLVAHNPAEASFPSGHTTVMFAIAFAILRFNVRWGIFYLVIALISATSRVVVGVHFPMDIVGGILVGSLSVILTKWLFEFWTSRVPNKKPQ